MVDEDVWAMAMQSLDEYLAEQFRPEVLRRIRLFIDTPVPTTEYIKWTSGNITIADWATTMINQPGAIPPWTRNPFNELVPKVDVPGFEQNHVTLDPNDPFDAALIPIVETNRRKRKDYALDGDPFSNFKDSSGMMGLDGFGPIEAADQNVCQKQARLKSLRANGRMKDPANEAVIDTYLDRAVFAIIAYAILLQEQGRGEADR